MDPLGGDIWGEGTCNPADANVFSGTFDGKGHVVYGLAAAGTLAGEVNGYAEASNVAVLSGKVTVNPSRACLTGFPPPIPLNHGTRQHKDISLIPLLP